jgi:SAM-dependent methyltransferase
MGASGADDRGAMDVSLDRSGRQRARVQPGVAVTDRQPGSGPGGRPPGTPRDDGLDAPLFTRAALDYAAHRPGQSLTVLQAGAATAGSDPDVATLRAAGGHVAVSLIDDDSLATRAAVRARPELASCALGDLRITPLPPRSFDIVHCALLLERISHAELVLDRFVEALKPGGLLLLSTGDRDCAAGFLDRVLPRSLRAMIWRRQRPGELGPYPAVYEHLVSGRGIQSYALRRGLVIGPRQALNLRAAQRRPPGLLLAGRLVARLSGGRLTSAHDELRYVIRKPESGFARVL